MKLDDVLRLLEGARSAVKFVVFDACRNELQMQTRDTSKGLVPVAEQQGMFVAFASAPGRTASDRGENSGPFAAALAREFGRTGLDHLNLFQNVKEAVISSTSGAQHPGESNGLSRRIYLTGEPTTPADIALWDSVRTSPDAASLHRYLERFPRACAPRPLPDDLVLDARERPVFRGTLALIADCPGDVPDELVQVGHGRVHGLEALVDLRAAER